MDSNLENKNTLRKIAARTKRAVVLHICRIWTNVTAGIDQLQIVCQCLALGLSSHLQCKFQPSLQFGLYFMKKCIPPYPILKN